MIIAPNPLLLPLPHRQKRLFFSSLFFFLFFFFLLLPSPKAASAIACMDAVVKLPTYPPTHAYLTVGPERYSEAGIVQRIHRRRCASTTPYCSWNLSPPARPDLHAFFQHDHGVITAEQEHTIRRSRSLMNTHWSPPIVNLHDRVANLHIPQGPSNATSKRFATPTP
ncbi:hypothetical protein LY76DRAFT_67517 [Colletotrichum caudatum]|nr:hypothetical protein LY76DRAFT_67517 [Colletotrichum caudatum]